MHNNVDTSGLIPAIKDSVNIVPFTGTNMPVENWVKYFDLQCKLLNINDSEKPLAMLDYLRDEALNFYIETCTEISEYSQIKTKFEDYFYQPEHISFDMFVAMKVSYEGDVVNYFKEKCKLGRKLKLNESIILKGLTEGLPEKFWLLFTIKEFKSPLDWVNLARKIWQYRTHDESTSQKLEEFPVDTKFKGNQNSHIVNHSGQDFVDKTSNIGTPFRPKCPQAYPSSRPIFYPPQQLRQSISEFQNPTQPKDFQKGSDLCIDSKIIKLESSLDTKPKYVEPFHTFKSPESIIKGGNEENKKEVRERNKKTNKNVGFAENPLQVVRKPIGVTGKHTEVKGMQTKEKQKSYKLRKAINGKEMKKVTNKKDKTFAIANHVERQDLVGHSSEQILKSLDVRPDTDPDLTKSAEQHDKQIKINMSQNNDSKDKEKQKKIKNADDRSKLNKKSDTIPSQNTSWEINREYYNPTLVKNSIDFENPNETPLQLSTNNLDTQQKVSTKPSIEEGENTNIKNNVSKDNEKKNITSKNIIPLTILDNNLTKIKKSYKSKSHTVIPMNRQIKISYTLSDTDDSKEDHYNNQSHVKNEGNKRYLVNCYERIEKILVTVVKYRKLKKSRTREKKGKKKKKKRNFCFSILREY